MLVRYGTGTVQPNTATEGSTNRAKYHLDAGVDNPVREKRMKRDKVPTYMPGMSVTALSSSYSGTSESLNTKNRPHSVDDKAFNRQGTGTGAAKSQAS
jgi:hypothetical protein